MFHTLNINKLLEMIFIAKIKYYNKPKVFILITYIYIYTHNYIVKKTQKKYFYDYENRNNVEYRKN